MLQPNHRRLSGDSERWRLAFLATGLLLTVLISCTRVVGAETSTVWRSDFKAALQEAEEKRLPLLVHFYADWCMPCQRMEREVFSNQSVRDLLSTRFVAIKINSDQRPDLVRRYNIETLPSDLIIDSLSGRAISLNARFQDRSTYVANVTQAETRFKAAHASDLQNANSTSPNDPAQTAQAQTSDQIELGDPKPVVGLDGYSPVALMKRREWTRGSAKLAWDYKDVTYHFVNREELIEFRNNPEQFAPKFLGCDAVILWESDKAIAGDIRFGAFFDDELYLFKSDERRRQFKANPEKYTRLQHALKADQIEKTILR